MRFRTPHQNGVSKSIARLLLVGSLLLICSSIGFLSSFPKSYAHFGHLAHYNTGGIGLGKYYINEQLDPEYTPPNQPVKISFSIQDNTNGDDVHNILTMMEIYSVSTGDRISVYPWTKQNTGDFYLYYTFPRVGLYEIVLSIADGTNSNHVNLYGVDPPRSILSSNLNCGCDRAVFNVSVSQNFGSIFNFAVFGGIMSAIVVFGIVLFSTYRTRIKHRADSLYPKLKKNEVIKYSVLILAVSSGIVHLAVYAEHGGLRIEYSIFLLTAGASQIAYSMLYVLLTIAGEAADDKSRESARSYYRKSVAVNLFGLVGSAILLGLYMYSVILPPPLSPNNAPEDIDIGGILDKTLEAALVIGVIYLMRSEKRNLRDQFIEIK
ncbi:MAG TPA: hypothetical protein VE619_07510 [Nitrososphaeraceae archaeon]|nr:hypothetical protein [Nitrososphaeraceae archaeon]